MTRFAERIKTSLRLRMTLGMAIMLLPLVILGAGSFLASQSMVGAMEQVARTETDELKPVIEIQKLILQAALPAKDYLLLGDPTEQVLFDFVVYETDSKFKAIKAARCYEEEKERKLIDAALSEWEKARAVGSRIFAIARPQGSREAGRRMKAFDAQIGTVAERLNRLYDEVQSEIAKQHSHASRIQRTMTLLLILVFAGALLTTVIAGFLLSRSIILPIRALQDGVFRFGQGDNSFRVVLDRRDEFGQLAKTLNTMAERLEYDSLTGVYSRSEFQRRLKNELARALRYGHILTLLMVDLDHLKYVNDTYGHTCGDDALRAVAMRLIKEVRSFDSVARHGGEEFAVIMPETGTDGARAVAERLRDSVASRPITTERGNVLNITVSIGMASFPEDARSVDDLIAAADLALHAAKDRGRNRVVFYEPGLDPALRDHRA